MKAPGNTSSDLPSRWRCALVWSVVTTVSGVIIYGLSDQLRLALSFGPHWRSIGFDLALARLAAVCLAVSLGWIWSITTLTVVEAVTAPSRHLPPKQWATSSGVRRLVLLACGAVLASATLAPAHADNPQHGPPLRRSAAPPASLSGLPLPERAALPRALPKASPTPTRAAARINQATIATEEIVVRPGDSLWTLTERLIDGSDPTTISKSWPRLYRANRAQIGSEPDLIHPGLRLRIPAHLTSPKQGDRP